MQKIQNDDTLVYNNEASNNYISPSINFNRIDEIFSIEMRSIGMLSRTYICTSTMNLWVTGQSQNKSQIFSTINEQKVHKFASVKQFYT